MRPEFGEDIRRGIEFERNARGGLLDLLLRFGRGPEIGHRGALDHHRRGFQIGEHRIAHFGRGAHVNHFRARRRIQTHRPADQNHVRAAIDGGLRQRVSHLAAGSIGEIADRVERFLRGSGGDQNRLAFEIAQRRAASARSTASTILSISASRPGPIRAAGEKALVGIDDGVPAPPQRFDIGAHGFVLPHVVVHGGREHHRAAKRQIHGGEKIVRQAVRELAEHVGRGGSDQQQIVFLRDADMFDGTGIEWLPGWRRKTDP